MSDYRDWLTAERSGREDVADQAFARLVAGLPEIEVSAEFAARTAQVAWRRRARRIVLVRIGWAAAAGAVGIAFVYELGVLLTALLARSFVLLSRAFVWLLISSVEGARWWQVGDGLATAITDTLAAPFAAAAFVLMVVVTACGIYGLRRLALETDRRTGMAKEGTT